MRALPAVIWSPIEDWRNATLFRELQTKQWVCAGHMCRSDTNVSFHQQRLPSSNWVSILLQAATD